MLGKYLDTWMKGPSFCEYMAAVPNRMARADLTVATLEVLTRSKAVPGRICISGRATPVNGRPVAVSGLEL